MRVLRDYNINNAQQGIKTVLLCILTMWLFLSFHHMVNGDHWPTWGSLELERSCAGSPLVTGVRRCPGPPHLSPSHTPSSPRLLSAHYGSVCSVSSPDLTCRWSHHCWNLAEKWNELKWREKFEVKQLTNQSTNSQQDYYDNQLIIQLNSEDKDQ